MHDELHILADLGLIFSVAVALAVVFTRFRLPAVLAYVGTGVILGPPVLGLAEREPLELLAELGVVLLLFTVGLEFSLGEIRRSWRAVLLGGTLQVALSAGAAAGIAIALGRSAAESITWGFVVSLSSTAVVLRLLDIRGEMRAAHGRLVVGILIFQDLCVVPMMLLLPVLAGDGGGTAAVLGVLVQAVLIVLAILVGSRFVVPRVLRQVAASRNREVFLLAVLAIAGLTAYVTSLTGLSLALGAFLAGMVLADTQYSHQALAEVLPLRTVMMAVFFVTIGMLIDVDVVMAAPGAVAGLFGGILVGKFLIVAVVGLLLRVPVQVAALAAAALAQVGEFSFVVLTAAVGHGLVSSVDARLFLAASVLTIAVAPLAVALSPRVLAGTRMLRPLERLLDGTAAAPERGSHLELAGHVIVAGLGVGGRTVVDALERVGLVPVIIELNPQSAAAERARGRHVVFGDVTSHEVLAHAGVQTARAAVIVVSHPPAAHRAAEVLREIRPDLPVVMRTRYAEEEGAERAVGADVLSEEFAGALAVAGMTLRRCGVTQWSRVIATLVAEHERLPPEEEGGLGPPPARHAAEVLARPQEPTS